jgi:hypothetical protein
MKSILIAISIVTVSLIELPANTHPALEKDQQPLEQRYLLLKARTETFNEYKVIKETLLDSFWKMTIDSISSLKTNLDASEVKLLNQQHEINALKQSLAVQEEQVAGIVFDGTHINFVGIDFRKSFFTSLFVSIVLLLILAAGLLFWRFKAVYQTANETKELFNQLNSDFESYKRIALEKQIKLSRELQTERNRLQEIRSAG